MMDLLAIGLSNALLATLLAVIAAMVSCGRLTPAARHALWLIVLLKLLTPPLLAVPVPWPASEPEERPSAALPASDYLEMEFALPPSDLRSAEPPRWLDGPAGEPSRSPDSAPPSVNAGVAELGGPSGAAKSRSVPTWGWHVLVAVWLTGTLGCLALAAWRINQFQRCLKQARPAPLQLRRQASRIADRLGLGHAPGIWLVPGTVSPMLWSFGRPRLLLPARLWENLDPQQRETLLAHELAHLRRRDHWVRVLELLATALYWWHPVLWWARRELRNAEEECCDAWVIWTLPGSARAYARALLQTLEFLSSARPGLPAAASGVGQVPVLKRRLTMILNGTTPRPWTRTGLAALAALAAPLLVLQATWAQAPKDDKKEGTPATDRRPSDADKAKELEAARQELKKAEEEAAALREKLGEAERKLREARMKLERLGEPAPFGGRRVIITMEIDGKTHRFELPRDADKLPGHFRIWERFETDRRPGPDGRRPPEGDRKPPREGPGTPPAGGDVGRRIEELERRLERLIQELEQIRRERGAPPKSEKAPPKAEAPRFDPDLEDKVKKAIRYLEQPPKREQETPKPEKKPNS
ncbi:MAG: M56 family metallopeptidase [Gemmataceae bacterium]|nr:M56 family metallopeptidase [Gemmataceae bacterium]MDW8265007.1 M56 family metallopeptidase [Gemmataceae bacterium]